MALALSALVIGSAAWSAPDLPRLLGLHRRCVDPLPQLREAEPTGRTYALRDAHWNVRGNRIAGQLLAEELVRYARGG